jgi:VIT1/CCC1 family predicted Fe2+/Mn2+ transporter
MYGAGYNNNNYNQGGYNQQQRATPSAFNNAARATPSAYQSSVLNNGNEFSATNWTQGRTDTPTTNIDLARQTPSTLNAARGTPPPPRKGQTVPPTPMPNGGWNNPEMGNNNGNWNEQAPQQQWRNDATPAPAAKGAGNLDVNSAQKALSIRGRDFYRAASMSFNAGEKPWEMGDNGSPKVEKTKGMDMQKPMGGMNSGMDMGMNGGGMDKGMGMGMGMNNGMGMGMGYNNGMGMGMNSGMDMGYNNGMGMGMNNFGMQQGKQPTTPYEEHQGASAQYLRDVVLGLNDGLVSVLLLTIGLAGGNLTSTQILLGGLTSSLAGAISMALGEYIATKSQAQVTHAELTLENEHLLHHRAKEIGQVRAFMQELNVKGELLDKVANSICQRDEAMIRLMMAFEFGFQEELERSPLKAMLTSGLLFMVGSLPAFLPYAATNNNITGLGITIALGAVGLFSLGAGKCYVTKGVWWYDGLEVLLLGSIGGGMTFGLGQAYKAGTGA